MNLQDRDAGVVWHPFTQSLLDAPPIAISRAEQVFLFDTDNKPYIDAIASWWAVLHGHSHPHITARIAEQLEKYHHVIFSAFTHEPAIELAERLLERLPKNQKKVFYSDNGSTAVEIALKMAVQFWSNKGIEKTSVIAFENAYHGDTFGAMSVSEADAFTKPFAKLLFPVLRIPTPVPGREDECFEALKKCISENEVAAFVYEPLIAGATGMHMYSEKILDELVSYCRKKDVFTIADEVMTGFGRTGHEFASGGLQHPPDMMCFSKGLTGGTMALGATSVTDEIFNAFKGESRYKALLHGHTFTGNPLACVSGLASMDLFEKKECRDNIDRIDKSHQSFVQKLKGIKGASNPRSKGVVLAFEVQSKDQDGYASSMRDNLLGFFLSRGIHLRPLGNTVYILPPYCITNEQLAKVYDSILEALARFGEC